MQNLGGKKGVLSLWEVCKFAIPSRKQKQGHATFCGGGGVTGGKQGVLWEMCKGRMSNDLGK